MISLILFFQLNATVIPSEASKSITPQSVPECIQSCPIGNSGQPERN